MNMAALIGRVPSPLARDLMRLMRMDRPIGTWLLMWPALWAVMAAQQGRPDPFLFILVMSGAFVARSAGCVANDLADRNFDAHVERTKERPIASGRVSVVQALMLLAALTAVAFVMALQTNWLVIKLFFVGVFLGLTYPLTKRFFDIPQLYMGAAFGWGAILAWAAAANAVAPEAWLIFAATVAWATGYDTIYAMMDEADDVKIGVKSSALFFNRFGIQAVGGLYLITVLVLALMGVRLGLGLFYFLGLAVVLGHFAWQLIQTRNHRNDPQALLPIFLSNKWVGLIICLALGAPR